MTLDLGGPTWGFGLCGGAKPQQEEVSSGEPVDGASMLTKLLANQSQTGDRRR